MTFVVFAERALSSCLFSGYNDGLSQDACMALSHDYVAVMLFALPTTQVFAQHRARTDLTADTAATSSTAADHGWH